MAGRRTAIETWASGKAKKNRLDIQRESSPAPQTNPPRGYDPFHYSVLSNRGAGQLFCFSFWWLWFEEANEALRSPVSSLLAGLGRRVGGWTKLTVSGERERQHEQGLCFWASIGRVHPCTKQMVQKKKTTWLPVMKSERVDKICEEMVMRWAEPFLFIKQATTWLPHGSHFTASLLHFLFLT